MEMIRPGDPDYDESRTVFNSMVDKHPAVIAQCATPEDVIEALAMAQAEGYEVAVRAGGHSVAGMCLNDGGLVIDVRPMKEAEVDPGGRTIRAGAGLTWGEFDQATQGPRPGHHRRPGIYHRGRRPDPRRRVGMVGTCLRPLL